MSDTTHHRPGVKSRTLEEQTERRRLSNLNAKRRQRERELHEMRDQRRYERDLVFGLPLDTIREAYHVPLTPEKQLHQESQELVKDIIGMRRARATYVLARVGDERDKVQSRQVDYEEQLRVLNPNGTQPASSSELRALNQNHTRSAPSSDELDTVVTEMSRVSVQTPVRWKRVTIEGVSLLTDGRKKYWDLKHDVEVVERDGIWQVGSDVQGWVTVPDKTNTHYWDQYLITGVNDDREDDDE
jgi:hypothetical protein